MFLPHLSTGESLSSKVHQTPVSLMKEPGGNVKLNCSHNVPNYNVILWNQQSTGDTDMKLIGYAYTTSITMEPSFKNLFNISGDGGKEAYLDIPSLRQPEDSAVYYVFSNQNKLPSFTSDLHHISSSHHHIHHHAQSSTLPGSFTSLGGRDFMARSKRPDELIARPRTINMIKLLIHVATLPLWVSGLSEKDKVHQTPVAVIQGPSDEVQLNCSHSISSYNVILWYQQAAGHSALKLIGYLTYSNPTIEESFKDHFKEQTSTTLSDSNSMPSTSPAESPSVPPATNLTCTAIVYPTTTCACCV
ncbi:hypothetical protein UPYG_G00227760 [Umbra pygmaea]|uniref:Immunoglobulin V-set domain-containing protein n=1 Tax=Umbra pygmaea TaxID=75934 RepID=A0ABD0WI43_UMBPY